MTRREGSFALTRAKTCTTSSSRFTGRMFEMCISTCSPAGKMAHRSAGGLNSSRFTKFGMTSIAQLEQPKARYVSSRRYFDTAVTASDFSIENRVIVKYEGSCPTNVMSVPCSVVTMGRCRVSAINCCAIQPEIACGIA
jgi:hypothetical protein